MMSILGLLTACGGMPDKSQLLEQARATYAKAETVSSQAQKYTLAEAKIALTQAEQSQNEHDRQAFARLAIAKSKLAMDDAVNAPSATTPAPKQEPPPEVPFKSYQTEQGVAFVLPSNPLFDEKQTDLEKIPAIQQIAQFLNQHPHQHALIEGHTQQQGHRDFNQGLSYRQANAVRFALMRQGIESNRIIVKGLGSSHPMAKTYGTQNGQERIQVTIAQPLNNEVASAW